MGNRETANGEWRWDGEDDGDVGVSFPMGITGTFNLKSIAPGGRARVHGDFEVGLFDVIGSGYVDTKGRVYEPELQDVSIGLSPSDFGLKISGVGDFDLIRVGINQDGIYSSVLGFPTTLRAGHVREDIAKILARSAPYLEASLSPARYEKLLDDMAAHAKKMLDAVHLYEPELLPHLQALYDGAAPLKEGWPTENMFGGDATKCFSADTPITMANGSARPIEDIRVGDTVLAFDASADHGRGALGPRKVVRLYHNTTTEWIKLTWSEAGEAKELISTPGHHFLDQFGQFPTIEEMLREGQATVVLASGELTEVTAERIIYSAQTAHQFERAEMHGMMVGNAALKPVEIDGWKTYNFEVEDLHTYVAGGIRVHNNSGFLGEIGNAIDSVFDAVGLDKLGDYVTQPFHEVGGAINGLRNSTAQSRAKYTAEGVSLYQLSKLIDDLDKTGTYHTYHINPLTGAKYDSGRFNENWNTHIRNPEGTIKQAYGLGFRWVDKATGEKWGGGNQKDYSASNAYDENGNPTHDGRGYGGKNSSWSKDQWDAKFDEMSAEPIILDLDGNGIEIIDLTKSTMFVDATGDGLQNRTAWAGAGDGVLFYDPDNLNAIVEKRQYVFTEWDPTATSDMEALASYFDSNGDGVLDASDAEFANFKVLVTNADGSTTAMTLAQLNITSINLTADATHIELPDGSMTGETIFIPNNNSAGKSTQSLGGYQ